MSQLKGCATAILFLRLFIGGVMLLHIIGKMQTYDNLVLEYPSMMGFSPATTLAVSMIVEGAFAALAGDLRIGGRQGKNRAAAHNGGGALGADIAEGAHIVIHEENTSFIQKSVRLLYHGKFSLYRDFVVV